MSIPDFALGETIDFKFTTRAFATGIPTTLAGTPVVDVYEDNSVTQITAGETLTVDFDSVTGLNNLRIVATSGNGYESGKSYAAVITTGTVDSVSVVGEVVAQFTIDRQSLRPTTAGNTLDVNATGEAGLDLDNTSGTIAAAQIASNAITADKIATDAITAAKIAADAIGASELATDAVEEIADQVWDEVLTGGTHNVVNSAGRRLRALQDLGTYDLGAIWIDTVNGTAGTTDFENGTSTNPVDTIADALTLSASLNINRFMVIAGSSITLTAAATNYELMGQNWTLAFGGQSIAGAKINGATISGTFTGTTGVLEDCIVNAITGPGATMRRCFFNDVTITNNGTAGWFLNFCASRVAGTASANFDFGVAVGASSFNLRSYSGGIELENMNTGDTASVEGDGNVTINANCSAGTLVIRGNFDMTDNSGSVTITQTARPARRADLIEGATFDTSTDSLEAIRNRGDAAWITATGFSTHAAADVWSVATRVLTANTNLNDPTAAAVADAVWDELQADHATAGTFGEIATEIAAILIDTDVTIPGLIAALNDLSAAQVNTEVADVIFTDTIAELAQAKPAATPTVGTALMLLYMMARNQVDITATLKEVHNDAGTVIAKKTLSDDGTTYSEAEMATGP